MPSAANTACINTERQFPESDVKQLITLCGNMELATTEVIMDQIKTVIKIVCVE
jgi:hypothetical protein